MPLNDRPIQQQQRWTQVGVIRLGEQVPTGNVKNGKPTMRPSKLSTFRVTSPSEAIVNAIAGEYGGEVRPWQSPSGPEFEVVTKAKQLPVLVPPQKIDPNYELYGARFLARKCDGITESKRGCPCLCKQGQDGHTHSFDPANGGECACGVKRECKPATRLSLMIANIPGLGTYKLESHGENAAAELPMPSHSLEQATLPIPAMLIADARSTTVLIHAGTPREKVEKRDYIVPILIFDWLTPVQAFGGQIAAAAKRELAGRDRGAIEQQDDRRAIEAKPSPKTEANAPAKSSADWIAEIKATTSAANLDALKGRMRTAGVGDKGVVDAWIVRARELTPTPDASKSAPATKPEPAADEVIDAVIVDDAPSAITGKQAWQAALEFAGSQGWNRSQLADRFMAQYNLDYRAENTTDAMFVEFLGLITNGDIG